MQQNLDSQQFDNIMDTLDSFEVRQMLGQTPSPTPSPTKPMTNIILSYLSQTQFFESLRNNYNFFQAFTQHDLHRLLKTGQIFRVKKSRSNMVINFSQSTVCIVIFGEVVTGSKVFSKDEFFILEQNRVEIYFRHKTTLVMLHKEDIENKLFILENYYFKKKQIEKIFPAELLQFNKKQIHLITESAESLEGSSIDVVINKPSALKQGIFILFEGNFALKTDSGLTLTELQYDYYGQEILWGNDYSFGLCALSAPYRLIFLDKYKLLSILSEDNIIVLKQLYKQKLEARKKMINNIETNLQLTKRFMKTFEVMNKKKKLEFKQFHGAISRRHTTKQLIMQQNKRSESKNQKSQMNNKTVTSFHQQSNNKIEMEQSSNFKAGSQFRSTIYKDQKAQSQRLFRKKTHTEPNRKSSLEGNKTVTMRSKRVQSERSEYDKLPTTITMLMKYYASVGPLNLNNKEDKGNDSRIFLASSRQRRVVTNMKLHRQIFFKQFFEVKSQEDKAFKTWR